MRKLITGYILTMVSLVPLMAEKDITKPHVVLSGSNSSISNTECYRIMSQRDWTKLWLEHVGDKPNPEYDHNWNRSAVPEVNFNSCMVIAVFMGSSSNNAGLSVHSTSEKNGGLVIRFDTKYYQSRGAADKVTPYGFFIIPRTDKAVLLQVNKQSYRSRIEKQPAVWKDYHRFESP